MHTFWFSQSLRLPLYGPSPVQLLRIRPYFACARFVLVYKRISHNLIARILHYAVAVAVAAPPPPLPPFPVPVGFPD
jgi:hypothetical protein